MQVILQDYGDNDDEVLLQESQSYAQTNESPVNVPIFGGARSSVISNTQSKPHSFLPSDSGILLGANLGRTQNHSQAVLNNNYTDNLNHDSTG